MIDSLLHKIIDNKPEIKTDNNFIYMYHTKEYLKEKFSIFQSMTKESLKIYAQETYFKDIDNFVNNLKRWTSGNIDGQFPYALLNNFNIELGQLYQCIELDKIESEKAIHLPCNYTCFAHITDFSNIELEFPREIHTEKEAVDYIHTTLSPWANVNIKQNTKEYRIKKNECIITYKEPYIKMHKDSISFNSYMRDIPYINLRTIIDDYPLILTEYEFFLINFRTIIENLDIIINTPKYYNVIFDFAYSGFSLSGGKSIYLGHLAQCWQEGVLYEKCNRCNGRNYVFKAGASSLGTGNNIYWGYCADCNSIQSGTSEQKSIHAGRLSRSRKMENINSDIDLETAIIELSKNKPCNGRKYRLLNKQKEYHHILSDNTSTHGNVI